MESFEVHSFNKSVLDYRETIKSSFSLFHLNTRSLRNKFDELTQYLNELRESFDVLGFSETWYNDNCDMPIIDNYKNISMPRTHKRGGGVCAYIKTSIAHSTIPELCISSSDVECLALLVNNSVIIIVYRPPSGSIRHFYRFLEETFDYSLTNNRKAIYIGDININLLSNQRLSVDFLDMIHSHGFENCITSPTRITDNSESLLDVCLTNDSIDNIFSGTLTLGLSDHMPIFCILPCYSKPYPQSTPPTFVRQIDEKILTHFRDIASNTDWTNVIQVKDPNI